MEDMKRLWLFACVLTLAACGDGVVEGDFLGDPQITLRGTFNGFISGQARPISPHMAVIWSAVNGDSGQLEPQRITEVTPVSGAEFPWSFRFNVYNLPPEDTLRRVIYASPTGPTSVGFAPGLIMAFDDVDGDGALVFDTSSATVVGADRVIGISRDFVLGWFDTLNIPSGGPSFAFNYLQNPGSIRDGYQLIRVACGVPVQIVENEIPTVVVDLTTPGNRVPEQNQCP